jgi:hypothetical protein
MSVFARGISHRLLLIISFGTKRTILNYFG